MKLRGEIGESLSACTLICNSPTRCGGPKDGLSGKLKREVRFSTGSVSVYSSSTRFEP